MASHVSFSRYFRCKLVTIGRSVVNLISPMKFDVQCCAVILLAIILPARHDAAAQEYNALAECRAQSLVLDRIHDCLDDYLDILDGNMREITGFLEQSLRGDALVRLGSAQQAFDEYRRENCLWYLEFSAPQEEAEQIAKNCLADMSRARLQELQNLVTADTRSNQTLNGYYVYGVNENYFQPCGRSERFSVGGKADAVDLLQRSYETLASSSSQLLYAVLVGALDDQLQAPDGYQGSLQLSALIQLRVPTDADCKLPIASANAGTTTNDVAVPETTREVLDDERLGQEEPEQMITAIFGDWTVECAELDGRRSCSLDTGLKQDGSGRTIINGEFLSPRLVLNRTPRQSTFIQVIFPGREIESPSLVRWQVDKLALGDIVGSEIRVDRLEARLLVSENQFLVEKLMPLLLAGQQLVVSVQDDVDDISGDRFVGTLKGLTKSLTFADDFVRDDTTASL